MSVYITNHIEINMKITNLNYVFYLTAYMNKTMISVLGAFLDKIDTTSF